MKSNQTNSNLDQKAELTRKLTALDVLPTQQECITLQGIVESEQEHGWEMFCQAHGMYQIVHKEMVDAIYELLSMLKTNCLVEIAAGNGKLAYWLQQSGLEIIATDNNSMGITKADFVEKPVDHMKALEKYNPDVVLLCWPLPNSIALDILDYPSVRYLVHLGNAISPQDKEIKERVHVRPNDLNVLKFDVYTYPTFRDSTRSTGGSFNYLYEILPQPLILFTMDFGTPKKVNIIGTQISDLTLDQTTGFIFDLIISEKKHQYIATINAQGAANAATNPEFQQAYNGAALTVADGSGVIAASIIAGNPIKNRVIGRELFKRLYALSAYQGISIYILGAQEGIPQQAIANLEAEHDIANVAGHYSPPNGFFKDPAHPSLDEVIQGINAKQPSILILAGPEPYATKWIADNIDRLDVNVAVNLGQAVDVAAGIKAECPHWISGIGMEWLWRGIKDPMIRGRYTDFPVLGYYAFKQRFLS